MRWLLQILRSLGWERQAARPRPAPVDPVPVTNLVAVINETRARFGVGPVWESKPLDEAAKLQAEHQAQLDVLTHGGPLDMPQPADRLARVGVKAVASGEICAMGQRAYWPDGSLAIDYDFRKACSDWLTSPGHRAILLDPRYTHAGAWMATNGRGRTYSTAVFARLNP